MTISSTIRRAGPYAGNGVATSFAFNFKVFLESEVVVTQAVLASGVESALVLNTDYVVVLNADQNNNPGGSITYPVSGSPMASTHTLTLTSGVEQTQGADIQNAGGFFPEVIEDALDREMIVTQQETERADRTLRFPVSDASVSGVLPTIAQRNSKVLAFDAAGEPIAQINVPTSGVAATAFAETLLDDANASTARATLGSTAVGDAVFIAVTAAAARATLGSTAVGDAVFIAATAAAARTILDVPSNADLIARLPAGVMAPYAGAAVPTGWLECDGAAVSRTTYADLFAAIASVWGDGDGSTTFNLPDYRDKAPIGAGTGTVVEAVTASSANGFTVAANNDKWHTGMTVVLSALTGFTTSATAGPTYYAVRISSTNVRLATTLALAQNLTPDITISGTGTATLTHTYTARTLGEYGGKEGHAQTITELLAHTHSVDDRNTPGSNAAPGAGSGFGLGTTGFRGGNAAMPIMNPFAVSKFIIKT